MPELYYTPAKAQVLLEEIYDAVINETDPDMQFASDEIFKEEEFTRAVRTTYNISGPGMPEERVLLQNLAPVNFNEGELHNTRPISWGARIAFPKELTMRFSKYGLSDAETAARITAYADFMRMMKYQCNRRKDLECFTKLVTNGTSTATKYADRYGEALFATSHTGIANPEYTVSNLSGNLAFTENNIMTAITAINNQKDENGAPLKRPSKWTIVTGSALETKGWQILNTPEATFSAENTKNRVASMKGKINHVVWNEFENDDDSWYVLGEGHSVFWAWEFRPYFEKESKLENNSLAYAVNMSGASGHDTWRKTYGAPES